MSVLKTVKNCDEMTLPYAEYSLVNKAAGPLKIFYVCVIE